MNKREEIENLQTRIRQLQAEISNCKHDWGVTKEDPEFNKEPCDYKLVGHGSDIWHEPQSYRDVRKDRWSRECKVCGKKEYTYSQEVIEVVKQPKFN